ncbi:MAG: serine hydrolase [Gemmatimonadetes bacterium]|nr:serine hydrolase [Gemmatimonadota bacterium]
MNRIRNTAARALALVVLALAWAPALRAQAADPLRGLDAYIQQAMRDWDVPGLAVAIVRNDSVVYAKGFGVREAGKPERVDENTIFAVASNTKAVTATALGLLVSEGRISWSDHASKYLPYFQLSDPWATRELTVRDMLGHHAGYATWQGDLLWYGSDRSTHDVLTAYRNLPPVSSFRSEYGYNNIMFTAAGEIIPTVTGTSWADFVRSRILQPLGMTRTFTSVGQLQGVANVAQPHTRIDGRIVTVPYRVLDNGPGAAALNSSVRDWAQWLRMQLAYGSYGGRRIVDSAVIAQERVPQTLLPMSATTRRLYPSTHFSAYGMGWFLRDYSGKLVAYHSGGMDGMLSYTGVVPEANFGVAIFSNFDDQSLYAALFWEIVDRMLGNPERDWSRIQLGLRGTPANPEAGHVTGTHPSLAPEGYAGTYVNPVLGEATVTAQGGALRLQVAHSPGIGGPLAHWQYDTFRATWQDRYLGTSLVTFTVDATGKADTFRMSVRPDFVDPQEYVFTRVK